VPKEIKGDASRKPPVPVADHAVIEEWVRGLMPAVQPLADRLDRLICATLPHPQQYAVKWAKAYYGTGELGWVVELAAYHRSANVVFLRGADFGSPPPLGSGRSRYVKLYRVEEADDPQLRSWIEEAGRTPGWR
jgi:hypothetical protein